MPELDSTKQCYRNQPEWLTLYIDIGIFSFRLQSIVSKGFSSIHTFRQIAKPIIRVIGLVTCEQYKILLTLGGMRPMRRKWHSKDYGSLSKPDKWHFTYPLHERVAPKAKVPEKKAEKELSQSFHVSRGKKGDDQPQTKLERGSLQVSGSKAGKDPSAVATCRPMGPMLPARSPQVPTGPHLLAPRGSRQPVNPHGPNT